MLGRLSDDTLCEALFDLYLGDVPVNKPAAQAAGASLRGMAKDPHRPIYYQPSRGQRIVCDSQKDLSTCSLVC